MASNLRFERSRQLDADYLKEWEKAQIFTDLLKLNIRFLRGEVDCTPYHGPLDEETYNMIDGLLNLHDLRILTTGSQPWKITRGVTNDGQYYEEWQRPALIFAVADKDQPQRVLDNLLLQESAGIIRVYGASLFSSTVLDGAFQEPRPITIYRTSRSLEGLKEAHWESYSVLSPPEQELEEEFLRNEAWRIEKPWVFQVYGRSWTENTDLIKIVAMAASKK